MKNKNVNRTKPNLFLDIGLAIAFVVSLKPFATGLAIHEWLGLGIGAALCVHLLLHWRWVVGITRKLFGRLPGKTRAYYALDAGLLLSFVTIIISGVVMSRVVSPLLGLPRWSGDGIAAIHKLSSILTVVLLVVKLALHWTWIERAFGRYVFGWLRKPQTTNSVPAAVPVAAQPVTRRRFLVGGGAVLLGVLVNRWSKQPLLSDADNTIASVDTAVDDVDVVDAVPVVDTVVVAAAVEAATAAPEAVEEAVAVTPEATQAPAQSMSGYGTRTKCPKGLTDDPYPGRCRHYVDNNGNGYCDLSQIT